MFSFPVAVAGPLLVVWYLADSLSVEGSSCDTTATCTDRSVVLTVGDAVGIPQSDPTQAPSDTPPWFYGFTAVSLLVISAGIVSWQASRLRPGPISVGEILEVTDTGRIDRADLRSIIADRLARIGIQSATTVPASNLVEQTPSKIAEVPGFLARIYSWLTARNTEKAGYKLEATLRTSDRVDGYGLTFVATSRANGRQLHAETMWAQTPEEAARRVAFQIGAVVASIHPLPQTRRAPTWTPALESLRHYESASYYIESGRFDEAFLACQTGLEHDPASLPLRYLLGTLHERFGHFKSAADTYAGTINMLFHRGTAFSRTDKPGENQPPARTGSRPGGRLPFRRVVSDEATQILWRYAVSLTFGHRWIGRWLDDLRRSDGEVRPAPLGYRKEIHSDLSSAPAASKLEEIESQEMLGRNEAAKRMRGFFHVRYEWLLRDTFPILDAGVFGEQRQDPMSTDEPPGKSTRATRTTKPPKLGDERRRILRSKALKSPHQVADIHQWLKWLFECAEKAVESPHVEQKPKAAWLTYLRGWQLAPAGHPAAHFHPPEERPGEYSYDDLVTPENFDSGELIRGLGAIPAALAGDEIPLTRRIDGDSGTETHETEFAEWFSRQRILMLAYRVSKDLLKYGDDLDEDQVERIGFMVLQLDLRFFFLCCAKEEMQMLAQRWPTGRREVWSRPFLSPQLVRLGLRGVAYRREERAHELIDQLDAWATQKEFRLPGLVVRRKSKRDFARRRLTRKLGLRTRAAEWTRGIVTGEGNWNLWYYQGCLHAMALRQPPKPPEHFYLDDALEIGNGHAGKGMKGWTRNNDRHAAQAVNALNRSVRVRSTRGKTAIEAGVSDWLLFRDPDLDRLRPHLLFTRWSDGLFETDESNLQLERADRLLHYWSKGRYERPDRLSRLAGETFTIDLFSGPIRSTAIYLSEQASILGQANCLSLADCWELLQREHDAWCQMVGLPRFIGNPQMRVRAWRAVKDVTGEFLDYVIYPNTLSAYRQFRLVPIKSVVQHINDACSQSAADLERIARFRHRSRTVRPGHGDALRYVEGPTPDVERILRGASKRWWELLDALHEGEIGIPPHRPPAESETDPASGGDRSPESASQPEESSSSSADQGHAA